MQTIENRQHNTAKPNSDSTSRQRTLAHLVGLIVFSGMLTLPAGIKVIKMLGAFPLHIYDVLFVPAVLLALKEQVQKPRLGLALLSILPPAFVGLYNSYPADVFCRDFFGVLYVVLMVLVAGSLVSWRQVEIVGRYIVACLALSAFVELLITAGVLANPTVLRSSFSGSASYDSGMGRLITNVHLLAAVALSTFVGLYLNKSRSTRMTKLAAISMLVIIALAGSRLFVIMLAVPMVMHLFGSNRTVVAKRLLYGTSTLVILLPTVGALGEVVGINVQSLGSYFLNIVARLLTLSSGNLASSDQSAYYRTYEISQATVSIREYPFFGRGFGSSYMPAFFKGDSWLAVNGGSYVHDSFYWFLVKSGFVGLALWLTWVFNGLRSNGTTSPEFRISRATVVALLVICLVWNASNNTPDVLAFGLALGITFATRRGLIGTNPLLRTSGPRT